MKPSMLAIGSFFLAATLATIGHAAEPGTVRVELNGRTYTAQLVEVATGAATQPSNTPPTTQPGTPMPATPPATRPSDANAPATLSGISPFQVHLDATDVVASDALRDSRVSWDFGDPRGAYNTLDGFNAAHVYDAPGTYTLTRTLRTPAGSSSRQWTIDVKPAARRTTYVSADGDDKNDGRSPERAVRTFDRGVLGTNGGNGEVLFRRGDQFPVTRSLQLKYDDCRLAAYGDASKPRPVLISSGDIGSPTMIDAGGKRLIVEDLAFDAKAKPFEKRGTLDVLTGRGAGLVVRRCTVLNVNDLVNGNGNPTGVLIQDCESPLETGLRSYLAWVQGANWTILGNRAVNSTREHIVRIVGAQRINIQFNHFTNIDRRQATTQPDTTDTAKAAINSQKGAVLYVANNVLVGPNGVGPLGGGDGVGDKAARWIGAVVEHNRITGFFEVNHGAKHVTIRDNVLRMDDAAAFPVAGFSNEYGRGVTDLRIERNTVINAGKRGYFFSMWGSAEAVAIVGNVYIAPQLAIGRDETAVLYVLQPDLRSFTTIRDNVWPIAKPVGFAHNGVHYVRAKSSESAGYIEPAAWAKMPEVEGDRFEKLGVDDWTNVANAGADLKRLPPATTQPAEAK